MLLSKDSAIRLISSPSFPVKPDYWGGLGFIYIFFLRFDYDEQNKEEEKWEWGEVAQSSEEKERILAENFKITPAL